MDLSGKVALVTGAARRVGRAIAFSLAHEGMNVAVHYHTSAEAARGTTAEISALGVHSVVVQGNLSIGSEVERVFAEVEREFGRLDALVNSASLMERIPFTELTEADWERNLSANLTAPFLCIQRAARLMRKTGGGAVVNISDVAAEKAWIQYGAQSVSKAGLNMLTRVAARALAPSIRVNAIMPGPVMQAEGMPDEEWERYNRRLPLGHPGTGEDVAEAVVFLLKSDFTTGAVLAVDGGNLLV